MRRFAYLLLLVIFVSVSASCVSASTDCERWFIAYRRELAHSRQVQRIAAAKRRAKLYAQRKLSPPKPKLVPVVARSPRMTRPQTLHRINLACGVLPDGTSDAPLVAEEKPVPFHSELSPGEGIDLLPTNLGEEIAANDVPPPPSYEGVQTPQGPYVSSPGYGAGIPPAGPGKGASTPPSSPGTPVGPSSPGSPSGPGTPGTPSGPGTPGTPGTPSGPGTPGTPGTPDTPPPVVPEPSSYVLVLTGVVGAAGAIRRRFKA